MGNKNTFEGWFEQGLKHYERENYTNAMKAFDSAIAINPAVASIWNNRGLCLVKLGKYQESLDSFNKALSLDPAYSNAKTCKEIVLGLLKDQKKDQKTHESNMSNYGEFTPRFWAYVIDNILFIWLPMCILILLGVSGLFDKNISTIFYVLALYGVPIFYILYCTFSDCSSNQATYGKRRKEVYVVKYDGTRLSFIRALIREVLRVLFCSPILGILNALVIDYSQDKRGLHDRLAGTIVLKGHTH
jgi:uncharacterized RDD family membrane protein YckC